MSRSRRRPKTRGVKDEWVRPGIRLPRRLRDAIRRLAAAERRSVNMWVVHALEEMVAKSNADVS